MQLKRKLMIVISIITIILMSTYLSTASSSLFVDVSNNNPYYNAIKEVTDKDIMTTNNNKFNPNKSVTRAELAEIVLNLIELQNNNSNDLVNTVAKVMPSVVKIIGKNSMGSGVVINDNYVLTAQHVVGDSLTCSVTFNNNYFTDAVVEKVSEQYDLALVKVFLDKGVQLFHCDFATNINIGETAFTIGCPLYMDFSVSSGIVSALDRKIGERFLTQIDVPINGGNSGGALFNKNGEIIGIVRSSLQDSQDINFAVRLSDINEFLK